MLMRPIAVVVTYAIVVSPLSAQESRAKSDSVARDINELHKTLTDLINKDKVYIKAILDLCTADVIFTPADGTVCHGKHAVEAYFKKMMDWPTKRFDQFSTVSQIDGQVMYPGPTAVVSGPCKDHYKLTNGMEFTAENRWNATVVKDGDRWLVANLHVSSNIFDNPMLSLARQMLYWGAGIAGGGGLMIGLLLGWFLKRRTVH